MSTANDEENDQLGELKSKLPKWDFHQSWLKNTNGWGSIHQRVCSVHFAKNQIPSQSSVNKLILIFPLDNDCLFNSLLNIAFVDNITPSSLE